MSMSSGIQSCERIQFCSSHTLVPVAIAALGHYDNKVTERSSYFHRDWRRNDKRT